MIICPCDKCTLRNEFCKDTCMAYMIYIQDWSDKIYDKPYEENDNDTE